MLKVLVTLIFINEIFSFKFLATKLKNIKSQNWTNKLVDIFERFYRVCLLRIFRIFP